MTGCVPVYVGQDLSWQNCPQARTGPAYDCYGNTCMLFMSKVPEISPPVPLSSNN